MPGVSLRRLRPGAAAYVNVLSGEWCEPEAATVAPYRGRSGVRHTTGVTPADIAAEQRAADAFARAAVIERRTGAAPC